MSPPVRTASRARCRRCRRACDVVAVTASNPRRCLLYVPGAQPQRFAKAVASDADQVCIDLEDAVAPAEKDNARRAAFDFLLSAPAARSEIGLRVNAVTSEQGRTDLSEYARARVPAAFVMLPKVESAADIELAQRLLGDHVVPLIAQLESPRAVFEARAIAGASPHLQALMFGGFDYAVAARARPGRDSWLWPRAQIAAAAAEAGLGALDVPNVEINDPAAVGTEAAYVCALGFTGKTAIHPAQVATIQSAFLPTQREVDYARRVLDASRRSGGAAVAVDGKMVDRPVELAAQRTVALAAFGVRPE